MSQNCLYSDCVYFDKITLRTAVEHKEWYRPLFNFLFSNNLYIAFSDSLLVELSQGTGKHTDLNTFFTILPSAKIKSFATIIEEETRSYPKMRTDTLLSHTVSFESEKQTVAKWFISDKVKEAKRKQLIYAKHMKQQLNSIEANFKPSNVGIYTIEQAEVFAWMVTMKWLTESHPDFMRKLNTDGSVLKAEAFPSIQLYAYYVYYKCYLGNSKPKDLSEFGDLFQLFYFPYCKLIILENAMCSMLYKIRSHFRILDGVDVKTIKFFSDTSGR